MSDWLCPTLPGIIEDFAGKERCTVMSIWDAHRLTWLAAPRGCNELFSKFPGLQQWAMSRPFELWGYLPVDSSGPNDRLTFPIMKTLLGFDRLLAYGPFGEGVIRRTIGDEESDKRHLTNLPHGICGETFYELPRKLSRKLFLEYTGAQNFFQMIGHVKGTAPIADDEVLIHIVATNQNRKDWCCGLEACAILAKTRKIRVWCHLDDLERFWSIPNLLADFGLLDKTIISLGQISDERMATAYSACDIGLGIGLGEGMGYPIFESLFCGTPCLHINYGGAPHWMQNTDLLVEPVAYRYEGAYASQRPVSNAQDWATNADAVIGKRVNRPGELDWNTLWPKWEAWFREAANGQ
jgi:glycosyltransferase involved in cell wall biosynthesis